MNKEDEEFLKRLFYWENGIRVTYIDIDNMCGVGEKGDVDRFIDIIENLIKENKELKEENLHWKGKYHLLSRGILED